MGGCRCTYRSCTMRSNKLDQVHMFHYPVFDKPRCHQWLTNAQKLNFLNLKVSQLKNRVVCENHFKDSEFMNYTKAKLKYDAVPTEDGPYCQEQTQEQEENILPINLEDIEHNDQLTLLEKKAHFPVKYGDFLMNEISEPIVYPTMKSSGTLQQDNLIDTYYHKSSTNDYYDNMTLENSFVRAIPQDSNPVAKVIKQEFKPVKKILTSTPKNTRKNNVKIISEKKISEPVMLKGELQTVSPSLVLTVPNKRKGREVNNTQVLTHYNIEIPPATADIPIFENKQVEFQPAGPEQGTYNFANSNQIFNVEEYNLTNQNIDMSQTVKPEDLYVLQEVNPDINQMVGQDPAGTAVMTSTVDTPVSIPIDTPVSIPIDTRVSIPIDTPVSIPIDMPDISTSMTKDVFTHTLKKASPITTTSKEAENVTKISASNEDTQKKNVDLSKNINITPTKKQSMTVSSPTAIKSAAKSKLPPEKMAEIVEKRKYNMKLRDIITSCIDKLDEEPEPTKITENKTVKVNENKVGDHLLSNPSSGENIMAYLETRLQRMEDTLLNKIDQNTQRITELKNTYKPSKTKKSTFTQTYVSLDTKKHLYQQISKYLTPEANSLVYEELFINKYSEKILNKEPPKKRKRR